MSDKNHALRAVRMLAAAAFLAAAVAPLPMSSTAQAQGTWYHHCSPNPGAIGPHYIVPPNVSRTGLHCFEAFWSLQEATSRACYFTSLRRNMVWPQMTASVPAYGIPISC